MIGRNDKKCGNGLIFVYSGYGCSLYIIIYYNFEEEFEKKRGKSRLMATESFGRESEAVILS